MIALHRMSRTEQLARQEATLVLAIYAELYERPPVHCLHGLAFRQAYTCLVSIRCKGHRMPITPLIASTISTTRSCDRCDYGELPRQ
jgi:hypothetical protein